VAQARRDFRAAVWVFNPGRPDSPVHLNEPGDESEGRRLLAGKRFLRFGRNDGRDENRDADSLVTTVQDCFDIASMETTAGVLGLSSRLIHGKPIGGSVLPSLVKMRFDVT